MEIYLDNSATTKPYREVVEAVADTMENCYGNPSSAHKLGLEAERKLNGARDIIAKTINCGRDEVIFTSGGSESNNFLLRGFVKEGANVITTGIEHPSILNTCGELYNRGVKITYLKVDSRGKIDLNELANSIDKDTKLVSIMHVNNEIGIIQDLETIGKIIKEKSSRAKFHVDSVQSYGKLNIDVQKFNIDLLSASGHKIHGPKGIGFAYVRKGLIPKPLILGGGQEKTFRSGTENLPGIVGLAKAAEIITSNRKENYRKIEELKEYFIEKLGSFEKIKINSGIGKEYSPYVLSVSFEGVKGEVLLHALEADGIYVSTGSACSARSQHESHVLKSIGLKPEQIRGTIRFSFSEQNTKEEVDYTIKGLNKSLKFLRRVGK
ncbi:MAG: Cysteine desulfurase [Clostridiaceae bacterium]|nr:Cysteine desulfurase [Clostridiaceae bacterium]